MNRFFKPYLDLYVIVFIYDILIYLRSEENHASNLRIVLLTSKYKKIDVKFSKCDFLLTCVGFLVHILSGEGIRVHTQKIKAVQS